MAKLGKEKVMERLLGLAGELSPENLTCDGELTDRAVNSKYRAIMVKWRKYEVMLGKAISESEVWDWYFEAKEKSEKSDAEEKARLEQTGKLLKTFLED